MNIVVTGLLNFAPLMQGQVDATAATDTGLAVGLHKGIGDVNVMQVSDHLNMSSDMFVVREEVFQQKKDLLKAFIKGYRESAAWMMANPEEASVLASKYAIDGTRRDINLDVIRLQKHSSMPAVQGQPLGSFDMVALQKGADAYRALGMVQRQIKVADVVVSLPNLPLRRVTWAAPHLCPLFAGGTTASLRGGLAVKAPVCCPLPGACQCWSGNREYESVFFNGLARQGGAGDGSQPWHWRGDCPGVCARGRDGGRQLPLQ